MKLKSLIGLIFLVVIASSVLTLVSPAFAQTGSAIFGVVFNDVDQDGEWDAGEAGVEGVTVKLDSVARAHHTRLTDKSAEML